MGVHASLAGRLGISTDEIDRLVALDEHDFPRPVWLALRYAQDWIFLGGTEPAGAYMEEFRARYAPRERAYILKIIRLMRFTNCVSNTVSGRPWRPGLGDTCGIDVK